MIFNIFLTIFLFLQLLWFTGLAGVLLNRIDELKKQQLDLLKVLQTMNEVNSIELKIFKDLADDVLQSTQMQSTINSGAKRPKKNKEAN